MKKMLLLTLLILLCGPRPVMVVYDTPLPPVYYDQPCQQPTGIEFYTWLEGLEPYGRVRIGGWDCSQMAAHIEWLAENCGHDAQIVYTHGEPGHAWVVIDGQPYDATGYTWMDTSPEYDRLLESVADAYWGYDEAFYKSWGWWITYPHLWEVEGLNEL